MYLTRTLNRIDFCPPTWYTGTRTEVTIPTETSEIERGKEHESPVLSVLPHTVEKPHCVEEPEVSFGTPTLRYP